MREIKFRGKRIDNGEWVYGDLIRHYENQRRFITCDQMAYTYTECGIDRLVSERFCEVDPETVGQYTGLKDKNGTEIYEGDIVVPHATWRYQMKLVVNFGIGTFDSGIYKFNGFYLVDENGRQGEDQYELHTDGEYKVIGNIHDNPEVEGME